MIILSDILFTCSALKKYLEILNSNSNITLSDEVGNAVILDDNAKELLRSYYDMELIQKEMLRR